MRNLFTVALSFVLVTTVLGQAKIASQLNALTAKEKAEVLKAQEQIISGVEYSGQKMINGAKLETPITGSYGESFEGTFPPEGWTVINNDGGSKTWEQKETDPFTGSKHASVSYETPNDDWLVSPQIQVVEGGSVQFMAKSGSSYFLESFNVKVSKTTTDVAEFSITLDEVVDAPNEYQLYSYTLTDHAEISAGDLVYVAIQCVSDDQLYLYVDDFIIPGADDASLAYVSPMGDVNVGAQAVVVDLQNTGLEALTSATLQWEFNGAAQTQVDWTGNIAVDGSENVTVGNPDFVVGLNTIKVWVENPNGNPDGINFADTVYQEVNAVILGQLNETFESGEFVPYGWATSNPTNDFDWSLMDDSDWGGYGFTLDNNYAGLLSNANGAIDTLFTPKLEIDGTISTFDFMAGGLQHTTEDGGGTLHVIYSADMETWTEAGTVDFTAGEDVTNHSIDISGIANGEYYFAFAMTNTYNDGDYINITGIDNVKGPKIAGLLNDDVRAAEVAFPKNFVNDGEETTITARVQNLGLNTINAYEVTLTIDGTTTLTANTAELQYGQAEMIEFTWTAAVGRHEFVVTVADDDNNENNEASIEGVVIADGLLTAGFEDGELPLGWKVDADANWTLWLDGFTEHYEGANGIAAGNVNGFEDAILSTRKVILTGVEELNFYATAGNTNVGAYDLDIVYSVDGETWTEIENGIVPTEFMELYTIDLGAIAAGEYYIGFQASGSGDGTYATWIVLDHIVGPEVTPLYTVNFTITDEDAAAIEGATISFEYEGNTYELITDATGLASIEGLNPGAYDYTVNAYGFETNNGTATVVDVDLDEAVTMIALSAFNVDFTVSENWGSNATVEGAAIIVTDGTSTWNASTTADGTAQIAELPIANGYTYTVSANGLVEATGTFDVVDQNVAIAVSMDEIIVDPYGLEIAVDNDAMSAILTWNPEGAAGFTDGFEDQTFDAWGEFIQGNGTGGDADQDKPYWAVETSDGGAGSNPEGDYVAHADWGYTIDTWLITPSISVSDGMTLSFQWNKSYHWSVDPNNNDDLAVKVSTDGGTTWETIWTEEEYGVFDNFTWIETTLDLSAYTGAAMFAFNIAGDDNAANEMDAVSFSAAKRAIGSRVISDAAQVAEDSKTDGGYKYTFIDGARNKAFDSFTIYLDGAEVATGVSEKTYTFESLTYGDHTAGVKSIYASGESEMITIDFSLVEPTYTATFVVRDENNTPVQDVDITIDGVSGVLTTNAAGVVTIDLTAGSYDYTVVKPGYGEVSGTIEVVDQDITEAISVVGVAGELTKSQFNVYPNPTNGNVSITAEGEVALKIMNASGMVVYEGVVSNGTSIDLSSYGQGLFLIQANMNNQFGTTKVLVK